jgi:hypothetical protein
MGITQAFPQLDPVKEKKTPNRKNNNYIPEKQDLDLHRK